MTATTTKNLPELQWYSLPIPEVAQRLESNIKTGLTSVEAEQRHTPAGIQIKMIAGDHPLTATAIARMMKLSQSAISQFIPSLFAQLRNRSQPIAYTPAIGVICIVILQTLFSQWSLMNQLFQTVPVTVTQEAISLGASLPIIIIVLLLERFDPVR